MPSPPVPTPVPDDVAPGRRVTDDVTKVRPATVGEVMACLDARYPPTWAEEWDSIGLACGDPQATVEHIHLALDPAPEVAAEAIALGAQMLFTHHPLFLRGVHSVAATTPKGRTLHRLVTAGVALANAHTNADRANPGVSDVLAQLLGLTEVRPLVPADAEAPSGPPAVDLNERAARPRPTGLGRLGVLAEPMTLREFAERAARALPSAPAGLRIGGDLDRVVRTVAVLGGSGDDLFVAVRASGADVYLTADLRHHPAAEALEHATPALIDAGHWATESPWLDLAARLLREDLAASGATVVTSVSRLVTDPWSLALPT